jgi:hypothetical protein
MLSAEGRHVYLCCRTGLRQWHRIAPAQHALVAVLVLIAGLLACAAALQLCAACLQDLPR